MMMISKFISPSLIHISPHASYRYISNCLLKFPLGYLIGISNLTYLEQFFLHQPVAKAKTYESFLISLCLSSPIPNPSEVLLARSPKCISSWFISLDLHHYHFNLSTIISSLNYCNSLLTGLPTSSLALQYILYPEASHLLKM